MEILNASDSDYINCITRFRWHFRWQLKTLLLVYTMVHCDCLLICTVVLTYLLTYNCFNPHRLHARCQCDIPLVSIPNSKIM